MGKEIIVLIVSGLLSTIAVIITCINNYRITKLQSNKDIYIEKIKNDEEKRKNAFEIAYKESLQVEESINLIWKDLQVVKETISNVLSKSRYDIDIAYNNVKDASTRVKEQFADCGSKLDESQLKTTCHEAKGIILSVVAIFEKLLSTNDNLLNEDVLKRLAGFRESMTDKQIILTKEKQNILEINMKKIISVFNIE